MEKSVAAYTLPMMSNYPLIWKLYHYGGDVYSFVIITFGVEVLDINFPIY